LRPIQSTFEPGLASPHPSYAIWTSLLKAGLARAPMAILENICMQSTASSAGYSTGDTLVSAFAACIIINHHSRCCHG
jgi:hypothetical protein